MELGEKRWPTVNEMEILKLPLQNIKEVVKSLRKMKKIDCSHYVRSEDQLTMFLRKSGGESLLESAKKYISIRRRVPTILRNSLVAILCKFRWMVRNSAVNCLTYILAYEPAYNVYDRIPD